MLKERFGYVIEYRIATRKRKASPLKLHHAGREVLDIMWLCNKVIYSERLQQRRSVGVHAFTTTMYAMYTVVKSIIAWE